MDIPFVIAALLLSGCALLLVFFPLWQSSSTTTTSENLPVGSTLDELQIRYQAHLSAIREIMFDYEMGKVTTDEYEPLLNKAKLEAANLRRKIDQLSTETTSLHDELESLITQTRQTSLSPENETLLSGLDAEIATLKNELPTTAPTQLACPKCNTPVDSSHEFCSSCGHKLEWKKEVVCQQCGYAYSQTDTYCARCGTLLKSEAVTTELEQV